MLLAYFAYTFINALAKLYLFILHYELLKADTGAPSSAYSFQSKQNTLPQ